MRLGRILRGAKAPWGFAGMVLLVLGVEGFVWTHRTTFMDYNDLSWAFTRAQVETRPAQAGILCLGDSRVKYALVPQVIEAATGRKSFNLAITAGRAPTTYYLLRKALDAGARPTAIVVDFDDKLLCEAPISPDSPAPWAELLDRREAWELGRMLQEPDFAPGIMLQQVVPTLKNRQQLRNLALQLLRGRGPGFTETHQTALRNWTMNRGAQVNTKRTFKVPPAPPPPPVPVEGTWVPNPQNTLFIERFLTLADERKIPVFWLLTPRCPTVQTWRDWYGGEGRYEQFVASFLERHPTLTILDARHSGYQDDVFVDTVLLDRDGAATLSADVALNLNARPRWAQLPIYREMRLNVAVEDFNDSKRALKSGAGGKHQAHLRNASSEPPSQLYDQRQGALSRTMK